MITKQQAIAAYEGNASELARALGIFPQAVYQWDDEGAIPEVHELKLKYELKANIFGSAPKGRKSA